jgi:hypothetical protein
VPSVTRAPGAALKRLTAKGAPGPPRRDRGGKDDPRMSGGECPALDLRSRLAGTAVVLANLRETHCTLQFGKSRELYSLRKR